MSATMPDILSNHYMATILGGIRSGEIRLQNVHTKDGKIYTIENYRCDDINRQLNFHFRNDIGHVHFSINKEYPFEIRKNEDGTYDFYQQEFISTIIFEIYHYVWFYIFNKLPYHNVNLIKDLEQNMKTARKN